MESSLRLLISRSRRYILIHDFHKHCDHGEIQQMAESSDIECRAVLGELFVNPRQKQGLYISREVALEWLFELRVELGNC